MKLKHIPIGTLAFALPILLAMSCFSISALVSGRVRWGHGDGDPFSEVLIREDRPKDYWTAVGTFTAVTAFVWFGVGFHVYRTHKQSREENPRQRIQATGGPRPPQPEA